MKYNIISLLLTCTLLYNCTLFNEITTFNLSFDTEVTVPATFGLNIPFNLITPEVETNAEAEFEINDTRKDLVEEVKLESLKLVLSSPDNSDFSFLNDLTVLIEAEDLQEIEVASVFDISEDVGKEIIMDVSGNDYKEYISKDQFSLKVNVVTDKVIGQDHTIEIKSVFSVRAKVI